MTEKKLLILRLEGPLQSWDDSSKWDERGTRNFPSKSGVVGLLGCALGLERGASELEELNQKLTIAVRADRKGEITVDYQTISALPGMVLRAADGSKRGTTIISKRSYLQDACFTVFLEVDEAWHGRLVSALKAPKWCLYLGRKACVPSRPVLECEEPPYASLDEALRAYPPAPRSELPMVFETEVPDDSLNSITRPDSLVDPDRGFVRRRVWRGSIEEVQHVSDEA